MHLLKEMEMKLEEVERLLYLESGLQGVSGISSDMQDLLASSEPRAKEAVELYCHLAARQIAGLLPALGGLDVLVFTGGIGENAAPVRERIIDLLRFAGGFPVYVIPTDEEKVIADAGRSFMKGK
jgi:acetate kinase